MINYLYTLYSISLSIKSLFQTSKTGRIAETFQSIIALSAVITWLYSFCHLGDNVMYQFECICESIYGISWQLMPLELQINMPIIIAVAQKPIYIQDFLTIQCTKEFFKKVCRSQNKMVMPMKILSYFLFLDDECCVLLLYGTARIYIKFYVIYVLVSYLYESNEGVIDGIRSLFRNQNFHHNMNTDIQCSKENYYSNLSRRKENYYLSI